MVFTTSALLDPEDRFSRDEVHMSVMWISKTYLHLVYHTEHHGDVWISEHVLDSVNVSLARHLALRVIAVQQIPGTVVI